MEQKITFNKTYNAHKVQLDAENPFLKITRIEFPGISANSSDFHNLISQYTLNVETLDIYGDSTTVRINGLNIVSNNQQNEDATYRHDKLIAWKKEHKETRFLFSNTSDHDSELIIYYTLFDQNVEIKNPFEDFKEHFSPTDNVKILFSAPFGQGKTTFLNYYFETHKESYEVFKLYPVNYSVSHNEDIFRFIKAELLFQLMGKDIEFEKEKFSYSQTAIKFFKKNPHKVLAPFLRLLPGIGKDASDIYEKFYKLAETYLDFHDELQTDDQKNALDFIKKIYDEEGNIYEDNYYTQITRQLLQMHKTKHKRDNVLIIDDLDRMDPDHIFRIFNVFAAHFDSPEREKNGLTNKFGFDKIILVCDIKNIQSIYAHKYGKNTSISGYLTKYFSKSIFNYDNAKAIRAMTNELIAYESKHPIHNSNLATFFQITINDLVYSGEITLRDLIKLKNYRLISVISDLNKYSSKIDAILANFPFLVIIAFFEKVFDLDTLKLKFQNASENLLYDKRINYTYLTSTALTSAFGIIGSQDQTQNIFFNNESLSFKSELRRDASLTNYKFYEAVSLSSNSHAGVISFSGKNFFEALLLNIKNYKEVSEITW